MENTTKKSKGGDYVSRVSVLSLITVLFLLFGSIVCAAEGGANLRRPISPEQPMWLVHIDTWNWADPQKIIDLIPEDILPYVVFNISLSINWDDEQKEFLTVQYGYETAKSWLRTCAENQVWAMIQPASGGLTHFPDYDETVDYEETIYAEFYRDYPNFLGFNYCEQFWGFDHPDFKVSFAERLVHLGNLVKLGNKYGGYVVVSVTGGHWGAALNPVAMIKAHPNFEEVLRNHPENFIICEKFTSNYGYHDIESVSLGMFLSGYAGNYGIRFDQSGWNPHPSRPDDPFPVPSGIGPVIEHVALTGQTVVDGPELIWLQCFRELPRVRTADGYIARQWGVFPQFENIYIDIFRKIIDGTIRILSREEVIDRTKVIFINDVKFGQQWDIYGSPQFFTKMFYFMDDDGTGLGQNNWFKKTGRFPAFPTAYKLADSIAEQFELKVNISNFLEMANARQEIMRIFPKEYSGDIYAGREENCWITYNPYKTGQTASGVIPFKYNTAESIELTYSPYTGGIIREYSDRLNIYLNNYDPFAPELKTSEIVIRGSTFEPTWSYEDRGTNQEPSVITADWSEGVFTLTVQHNGPVDITIDCAGEGEDRLESFRLGKLVPPARPPFYEGPRQYEAEHFDYKFIEENVTNGIRRGVLNYTGQGYLRFGSNPGAAVRAHVRAPKDGTYTLGIKYSVPNVVVDTIDVYVNGIKVATPRFVGTADYSDWAVHELEIPLTEGANTIEFIAHEDIGAASSIYFDHIIIDGDFSL